MLSIISIKTQTPDTRLNCMLPKGGYVSIKFKIEEKKDASLLMRIFYDYINSTFCGLPMDKTLKPFSLAIPHNTIKTITYSFQLDKITIK